MGKIVAPYSRSWVPCQSSHWNNFLSVRSSCRSEAGRGNGVSRRTWDKESLLKHPSLLQERGRRRHWGRQEDLGQGEPPCWRWWRWWWLRTTPGVDPTYFQAIWLSKQRHPLPVIIHEVPVAVVCWLASVMVKMKWGGTGNICYICWDVLFTKASGALSAWGGCHIFLEKFAEHVHEWPISLNGRWRRSCRRCWTKLLTRCPAPSDFWLYYKLNQWAAVTDILN